MKVKPLNASLALPFAGEVNTLGGEACFEIAEFFGVKFYLSRGQHSSLLGECCAPAWCVKATPKDGKANCSIGYLSVNAFLFSDGSISLVEPPRQLRQTASDCNTDTTKKHVRVVLKVPLLNAIPLAIQKLEQSSQAKPEILQDAHELIRTLTDSEKLQKD